MAKRKAPSGGEVFIVDNTDADWKVLRYLQDWTEYADKFDVATGYFEIGALLAMDGHWQKLDKLRILMGDQVSLRTRKALLEGITKAKQILDASIEREKGSPIFLTSTSTPATDPAPSATALAIFSVFPVWLS